LDRRNEWAGRKGKTGHGGSWANLGRGREEEEEGLRFGFVFFKSFSNKFSNLLNQTLLHLFTIFFINYFKDF
jgi:hypothetical protein